MATVERVKAEEVKAAAVGPKRARIGPGDHGRFMTLEEFVSYDEFEDGWAYELGRGKVVVTDIPGINHGKIVMRLAELFVLYRQSHPGLIQYQAGGNECRLRLPGMQSDRHPDQAVYLSPPPPGNDQPWTVWAPDLAVEVVSKGGEERDFFEKREEYLRAGVREYWILDPKTRLLHALRRMGDVWETQTVAVGGTYQTHLLPGLEVRPAELFGPEGEES